MEVRKSTLITIVVVILLGAGGYVALNNPFRTGAGIVERLAWSFMEDLQFKDFRESALYSHRLDQDRLDIGKTLEALFQVKPEFLDIMDYRIVKTDIDESGKRAKVLVKTRYKILNRGQKKPGEKDLLLYWLKRHPDCPQGGTCAHDKCVNEYNEIMYYDEDKKFNNKEEVLADKPAEATQAHYACDPNKDDKWFMNLDSSLKTKDFRDAKPKDTDED